MKRIPIYIIMYMAMLAGSIPARAQRLAEVKTKELPRYTCVSYDRDTLEFPAGREAFGRFYNLLDAALYGGERPVSILHIGGSHVQAGFFSNRVRSNLCGMMPSAQGNRGCLFPFRILRTNAPAGYSIEHTGTWQGTRCIESVPTQEMGIMGAAVQTADTLASLTLDLNANDSLCWKFNRLRVLGAATSEQVVPLLVWNGDTLRPAEQAKGESYLFRLPADTTACRLVFDGLGQGSFTLRGLVPEREGVAGITYHEAGVNGAAVPSWLKCSLLEQDMKYLHPDLVIFGIGINDANVPPHKFDVEAFKRNYRELIRRMRTVNPHCAFLFITNNDCFLRVKKYRRTYNQNTMKVEKAFRELAAECGGAVWNQFRIMGGFRSSASWQYAGLMRADRIHFTREGYELMGDLLYNALITDYLKFNGNN